MFKYALQIVALTNCPPVAHKAKKLTVFRFVWEDDRKPKSFLPVQQNNPKRKFKDDVELCENYALSLFDTEPNARTFYADFAKRYNAAKALGTHLVSVPVEPADGVISDADAMGHMDLYEHAVADLPAKCTMIGAL